MKQFLKDVYGFFKMWFVISMILCVLCNLIFFGNIEYLVITVSLSFIVSFLAAFHK